VIYNRSTNLSFNALLSRDLHAIYFPCFFPELNECPPIKFISDNHQPDPRLTRSQSMAQTAAPSLPNRHNIPQQQQQQLHQAASMSGFGQSTTGFSQPTSGFGQSASSSGFGQDGNSLHRKLSTCSQPPMHLQQSAFQQQQLLQQTPGSS
jgi:hypothetical protein